MAAKRAVWTEYSICLYACVFHFLFTFTYLNYVCFAVVWVAYLFVVPYYCPYLHGKRCSWRSCYVVVASSKRTLARILSKALGFRYETIAGSIDY